MACATKHRSDRDRQCRTLQHEFKKIKHKIRENNFTHESAGPNTKEIQTSLESLLKEDGEAVFGFELIKKGEEQKLIQLIESLESENRDLKKAEKEDKNYIHNLESQLKEKDEVITGLKEDNERLKKAEKEDKNYIHNLESQLKEKVDVITGLKEDNERLKKAEKEDKDYISSLLPQLTHRDGVIDDLKEENNRLGEKNTQLDKIIDSDRNRSKDLEVELKKTIANLTKDIASKDETIADVQRANKHLIAREERLTVEMETIKSIKKRLEQEKNELQNHVHQMRRSLEEQMRTIDKLQKNLSEEKKAKENALNRLSAAAANRLRDQNPGITDLSDPNRPLKLAEKVSELYDNEWTNAMENLESELNIQEEKGIKILLKIIRNVFDACVEFGDSHLQSFPDMLILPPSFIGNEKERMVSVKDLPSEMLKPMKDFRKSHAKYAINRLQKFFSTDEGKSKLQIKKKVLKTCEEYVNKCIELCWMMRIQDPPIYMESGYPTNSEFDSNKMRSYTKAGKIIHFVVWPTFFLHKDGPLLAKGVVQGSKIEIKDEKEINGDEECSSSSSDSDGEEFDDARSRTDSQPSDNLKKTTYKDDAEPNQQGNEETSQGADGTPINETNDKPKGPNDTNDIPKGPNNTDTKPEEPNNTHDIPKESNNDLHINQSKPPGSEATEQGEPVNSDETKGEDRGERAAEQKDASDDRTQNKEEETDV